LAARRLVLIQNHVSDLIHTTPAGSQLVSDKSDGSDRSDKSDELDGSDGFGRIVSLASFGST